MGTSDNARITSIHLCVGHREPMRQVDSAKVIAGFGIEGDAHAVSDGPRTARQILLMDTETLDEFGLTPSQVRENITTAGFAPGSVAVGQRLAVGDAVVLEVTGDCAPCGFIDEIRPGLREKLEGRRGLLATVVEGGTMSVGDPIRALERAPTG